MDTGKIKKFATEARNVLMQGVTQRLISIGFRTDGTIAERPQQFDGGATFMGNIVSMDFYDKWLSLEHAVQIKSITEVAEEAAYTWFNRLVAIRIMVKNGLASPVLEYESDDVLVPILVSEARQGRMPYFNDNDDDNDNLRKLNDLLMDDSKTNEQFALLIVAYCHSNPVINSCFGHISDYTELLLPTNILAEGGFVHMLNNTEFISEDDFKSPELIGWLYQFYISEKKDDVFASFKKGKKAEAKDIPAATQIFTPNWIVKYMVQNTVGRIYLDNNPYSDIKESMKYLVEPEEPTPSDAIFRFDDIHDLTCADLACGSGHILNECFDLLYQLYIEEGYSRRNAIEDIFKYNLTGVDLDTRAKQLAQFALLLKACQKDASFADAHCMPKVLDMPKVDKYTYVDTCGHFDCAYGLSSNQKIHEELADAFMLMADAENLGSIMKFEISDDTATYMNKCIEAYEAEPRFDKAFSSLLHGYSLILTLTKKYAALVMNPPYMGAGNMNAQLSQYVKDEYPEGKADLCTAMMEMQADNTAKNGYYANIVPPSWMFLSTFEGLRKKIIENNSIASLLHLSRGVFGADFGSVSCVIRNAEIENAKGTYFRLVERTFQEFDQKHLQILFEKTLANHDFRYFFADYSKEVDDIEYSQNGAKVYYSSVEQSNFEKIPGCPLGYWVSQTMIDSLSNVSIGEKTTTIAGLCTGDNAHYIFNWFEASSRSVLFPLSPFVDKPFKFHNKGGDERKWYGNQDLIVKYSNKSIGALRLLAGFRNDGSEHFYAESFSWAKLASSYNTFRYYPSGFCFDSAGSSIFFDKSEPFSLTLLGFLNSIVAKELIRIINPTINTSPGIVRKLPFPQDNCSINSIVQKCIANSKYDWNSHETSWDFSRNELLSMDSETMMENIEYKIEKHFKETGEHILIDPVASRPDSLEWCYNTYCCKWERMFMKLHENEEELNRQFIEIYGLQDELTPDVPLDEITILQQGEISIENNEIVWHPDVVMKQLISYAVGCMMGRYSLDKPGLILANQGDGLEEYNALVPDSRFEVDDDGIIPLMSSNTEFVDCATKRFKTWLTVVFGAETLVENLNFIEKALGKSIDDYFVKDFWKDHKKMYQNRPIYWLFSSKKGAFQCLAYMHRMTPYTAEAIRTRYLLPHIEWLVNRQKDMMANMMNLSTRERKELDSITAQIAECREYHDRLHVIADQQIAFDLDDGVVVNYAKFGDVLSILK